MRIFTSLVRSTGLAAAVVAGALLAANAARAADPIRVGTSLALTGGVAPIGKQVLAALQIWRDDVNAKGGLLGRLGAAAKDHRHHPHQGYRDALEAYPGKAGL